MRNWNGCYDFRIGDNDNCLDCWFEQSTVYRIRFNYGISFLFGMFPNASVIQEFITSRLDKERQKSRT